MEETLFQSDDDRQSAREASSGAPELEGYQFKELLGRGTFGDVWLAIQVRTGQDVAVKMLRADSGLDWRYLESELARLRSLGEHPNIVTLLDADLDCKTPYFVMPHLTGGSLQEQIGVADQSQVKTWFQQAASALAFSHERGLLHCDLKPSNILLDADSRVRLVDFGQSMNVEDDTDPQLGTLGFMPPEQITDGARPSTSWDIYALGATFYQIVSGGDPPRMAEGYSANFRSLTTLRDRLEEYFRMLETIVIPVWEKVPEINPDLGAVIMACLRRDPSLRIATARTIEEDLARSESNAPLEACRPWKKSYLLKRWYSRNRSAVILGLAVWCAVSMPVLWTQTDFEVPIPEPESPIEYELPATWVVDLPAVYETALVPPSPELDFNADGSVNWKDDVFLYSQVVAPTPNLELLRGEAVGRYLELYPKQLQLLEDWDSVLSEDGNLDWATLGLLAAARAAANDEPEREFRLAMGSLLLQINRCRTLWSLGRLEEKSMSGSLVALDYLQNLDYGRLERSRIQEAADRMKSLPYPGLAQVLCHVRDNLINRLKATPTLNLSEPPALSFFRDPACLLYKRYWNNCMGIVLESNATSFKDFRVVDWVEPSTLSSCMHPIKSGALYLMDRSVPPPSFCSNKLYLDSRWSAFQVHLDLELYKIDHGEYPKTLEDLVPRYLTSLPLDPYAQGKTFLYVDKKLLSHGTDRGSSRTEIDRVYQRGYTWAPRLSPFSIEKASHW